MSASAARRARRDDARKAGAAMLPHSDTQGLFIDLELPGARAFVADLRPTLRSADAVRMLDLALALTMRFVVIAGQLCRTGAGAVGFAGKDEADAIRTLLHANVRMGEIGSRATVWVFLCAEPLENEARAVLAEAAGYEGTMQ